MNKNKPSLFVKDLARYLFGKDQLLQSNISGKLSNRSKKMIEPPKLLDPVLISALRGKFYTKVFLTT